MLVAAAAAGCASGDASPPLDVTDQAATLRAQGSSGGAPTTYWFKYGTTESYGKETPHRDGGSGTNQTVSERVTGLAPDTLYHYTACASNAAGAGCGADVTFRTASTGLLPGFQETTVFSGLEGPTAVRFAPDGRIFVAQKPGGIRVFDGPSDTTPTTVANLRPKVDHNWDRGLLGLAIDPGFPARPFIYVLYTHDAPIGGTAPTWNDTCPTPPGATTDGCVVSARLSRLQLDGNLMVGDEQVLIEDWCQQAPTHSIGDLRFGEDGALYVSGGEGASPYFADYGQIGIPRNPCGDPPAGVGGTQTPPTAQGGALRSQDLRTPGDPTTLDGAILRVDPDTGAALPANPLAGSGDPDAARIVAYGLRNPYRFAVRPGTNEIWAGDVGWNTTEEINRIVDPTDATVENFGWPCYEGLIRQGGYDAANLQTCETLYGSGAVSSPYFAYEHAGKVTPEESCPSGTSSISGMTFTPPESTLPAEFQGALFFADYARGCIWVMQRNGGSLPSPSKIKVFRSGAAMPVDIQFGPDGDLYYADVWGGTIKRIHYTEGNQPPRPLASASATNGDTPLSVTFDASGSRDPDPGDTLTYAWDLDGDGEFDDATGAQATFAYLNAGSYNVGLRVTDNHGASATDHVAVTAGNTPPVAAIASPTAGLTWKVGESIAFDGGATDRQDGALPAASLSWSLVLNHCPSGCHGHAIETFPGTDHGSFAAPDHEYPSHLELRLTATDSGGLSDTRTIRLDPKTVDLLLASSPTGLELGLNGSLLRAPFTRTVIQGSVNSISAPSPQSLGGKTYTFGSWSDGGAGSHTITAGESRGYTAGYSTPGATTPPKGPVVPPINPTVPGDPPSARPAATRVARVLRSDLTTALRALRRASITKLSRSGVFRLTGFDALSAGTARARLTGKSVTLGLGSRRFSRAGKGTVQLRLTRAGRKLFAKQAKIRVTLRLSYTERSGRRTTQTATTLLRSH